MSTSILTRFWFKVTRFQFQIKRAFLLRPGIEASILLVCRNLYRLFRRAGLRAGMADAGKDWKGGEVLFCGGTDWSLVRDLCSCLASSRCYHENRPARVMHSGESDIELLCKKRVGSIWQAFKAVKVHVKGSCWSRKYAQADDTVMILMSMAHWIVSFHMCLRADWAQGWQKEDRGWEKGMLYLFLWLPACDSCSTECKATIACQLIFDGHPSIPTSIFQVEEERAERYPNLNLPHRLKTLTVSRLHTYRTHFYLAADVLKHNRTLFARSKNACWLHKQVVLIYMTCLSTPFKLLQV